MSEEYADTIDTQPPNPRPLAGKALNSLRTGNVERSHLRIFFVLCLGVIAYVDVRSGKGRCENRSKAIAKQLDNLGATVSVNSEIRVVQLMNGCFIDC